MAYRPYGSSSPIWSSEEYTPWSPPENQFKNLAIGAALGVGAFAAASQMRIGRTPDGQSRFGIDLVQSHWRAFSERTPFSILNTFRVAEALSPFVSGAAKNLSVGSSVLDASKKVSFYEYGAEFLTTRETQEYLRQIFGNEAFDNAGITLGDDFKLRYEQGLDSRSGRVLAQKITPTIGGKSTKPSWSVVSNKAALMETAPFERLRVPRDGGAGGKFSTSPKVNTAFFSVLQSLGMTEKWGAKAQTSADRLFAVYKDGEFERRAGFGLIPLEGRGKFGTARLAGAYASAPLAFGMERFNRFLQQVIEQVPFLSDATPKLEERLGVRLGVTSGKPLNMFMSYGKKAAAVGAGYMALQQVDWIRRNYSLPGEVVASGAVSLGAAYIFNKV